MQNIWHKNLTLERWQTFAYKNQILMIATEILRAKKCLTTNRQSDLKPTLERAFELIDLTIEDQKSKPKLLDLLHFREALAHFYIYESSPAVFEIFYDWLKRESEYKT